MSEVRQKNNPILQTAVVAIPALIVLSIFILRMKILSDFSDDIATTIRQQATALQVSTKVVDIDGHDIGNFGGESRIIVPLSKIPEQVQQTFLAAEDDGFYSHFGVSAKGLIRAVLVNFKSDRFAQGGSTITQQLIRQFLLPKKKTIWRKVREIILAVELERKMSKKEILEIWFNSIFLGNNSWGIESAALNYFGKHVGELTLAEASLLAGLPQAPSKYAPHLRPKFAKERQLYVLQRLKQLKWISNKTWRAARGEAIHLQKYAFDHKDKFPWVTETTRVEMWNRLEQKNLASSGLVVATTIKSDWQQQLQSMVADSFKTLHDDGLEMSLVVLDARSGEIRALIGGSNFERNKFNRALDLYRPFGGVIYPLLFSMAIGKGVLKIENYASLGEAAIVSGFAEAEQLAPEIGYGLVREMLLGRGLKVQDAMAIDEIQGSPVSLARAYLEIAGTTSENSNGLVKNVMKDGVELYGAPTAKGRNMDSSIRSRAWVLRQWMALASASSSKTLLGQPVLKAVKGWNDWWIIPRTDVVIAAWIGADAREPKVPQVLRNADQLMDQLLAKWIRSNLPDGSGVGVRPDGISYQLSLGLSGGRKIRIPFVMPVQGTF